MKLLVFSDVHFRSISSFSPFNKSFKDGITIELNRCEKSIKFISECVEEYSPDVVLCLGDVYHNLNTNTNIVVSSASKSFEHLYKVCKNCGSELFILNGNHDYINNKYSMIYSLSGVKILDNFELSNDVLCIPFKLPVDNMRVEIVKNYVSKKYKYIFCHDEFNGFYFNKNKLVDNSIDILIYNSDTKIISGHIHTRQEKDNVRFIGSIRQVSISEDAQFNGCEIINTDNNSYEFIENKYVNPVKLVNFNKIKEFDFSKCDGVVIYFNSNEEYDLNKDNLDIPVPFVVRFVRKEYDDKFNNRFIDYLSSVEDVLDSYISTKYPEMEDIYKKYFKGGKNNG